PLGGEIVGVPMDEDGLIPDELPQGDFAFLYTIPTFQNPSGRTLSLERRRRLAELARARPAGGWRRAPASKSCSSSRTTGTGSSATTASRFRACSSSPTGSRSPT